MNQAIVRTRPDRALFPRGLDQRIDSGVGFSADGIGIDRATTDFQRFWVRPGEIGTDGFPRLPFVGRLEDQVAADIQGIRVMRRKDDRIGPRETVSVRLGSESPPQFWPGRDEPDLISAAIVALE